MTDKLLPIVAGCQALIVKAENPAHIGRTVTVLHIILNTDSITRGRFVWDIPRRLIGSWLCEFQGGYLPLNDTGNPCPIGAFWSAGLLRIDGGQDLPVDASDIPLNMPQDWRDRNEVFRK